MDKSELDRLKAEFEKSPKELIEYYQNRHKKDLAVYKPDYDKNILELDKLLVTVSSGTLAFLLAFLQLEEKTLLWAFGVNFLWAIFILSISIFAVVLSYIFGVKRSEQGIVMQSFDELSEELSLRKVLTEETAFKISKEMEICETNIGYYERWIHSINFFGQATFLMGFLNTIILLPLSIFYMSGTNFFIQLEKLNWPIFFFFISVDAFIWVLIDRVTAFSLNKSHNRIIK